MLDPFEYKKKDLDQNSSKHCLGCSWYPDFDTDCGLGKYSINIFDISLYIYYHGITLWQVNKKLTFFTIL